MVNLTFKHGLLFTDLVLFHDGKEVIVNDVIIDTGAAHSIISPIFIKLIIKVYSLNINFSIT
ncbi:hypothetical protein CFB3_35300 [Clostridium folliculivorans]|uniref:Aspartyl protease n=1 Tax=Clostridium folliculivorans TaxID=2886038 RepID=A0A9W5Y500_9CLOT|nr:hypothetical protein CFOLD11_36560 [Clostridium folliculivorans]GKU31423.1 hypothetical protein CFB3_35300 [Clostridium folliculivorans]